MQFDERAKSILVMGFEGSANKIGVGIVRGDGQILTNVRKTYITPPGTGFQPSKTAKHHQQHIIGLTKQALEEANVKPTDLSALAYTRGPGMGGPLLSVAIVVRMLSQMWKKPIIPVNHCVGRILDQAFQISTFNYFQYHGKLYFFFFHVSIFHFLKRMKILKWVVW
eukprot:TRINITY_DN987_c0_g1_i9.p1 TRINITY_DN987_c0_g1~~TRINITY_DN987_c0_g1_i9.p1  ORF type:complete len:167 (-),score=27.82 TRINITY_DN987_c0_g1_i9:785-1285(-)